MLGDEIREGLAWTERVPFPVFLTLCAFATIWLALARQPIIEYMGRRNKPIGQLLAEKQAELAEQMAELAKVSNQIQADMLAANKAMDDKFGENLVFFEATTQLLSDINKNIRETRDEIKKLHDLMEKGLHEKKGFWN